MTTLKKLWYYAFVLSGPALIILNCCKKEEALYTPSVSTIEVTDITQTDAVSGGNVTDDGGAPVTARGVCWSTNQSPTTYDSKTEDGQGTGSFISSLSDLEANTTYYLRAYATNSKGTAYGNQVSFKTNPIPTYKLTLIAEPDEGGSVEGAGEYEEDYIVSLTAIPDDIYQFVNWTDEDDLEVSDLSTFNFTMPAEDVTLSANFHIPDGATGTVTDADGNVYQTIYFGGREWMAENLRYLPEVHDPSEGSADEPRYYVYGYSPGAGQGNVEDAKAETNYEIYGTLYNWDAAMSVCPDGWHLPDDDEWKELEIHLGMSQADADKEGFRGTSEGSKLAGNYSLWPKGDLIDDPEFETSGFNALPGGGRIFFGDFGHGYASFWSSTESNTDNFWVRYLDYYTPQISRINFTGTWGFSVRCIRD